MDRERKAPNLLPNSALPPLKSMSYSMDNGCEGKKFEPAQLNARLRVGRPYQIDFGRPRGGDERSEFAASEEMVGPEGLEPPT